MSWLRKYACLALHFNELLVDNAYLKQIAKAALTALAQVEGIKFIPLFDELELGAYLRPASSLEADQYKPGIASTSRDKEERGNMGNRLASLTRAIWIRSENTNGPLGMLRSHRCVDLERC